MKHSKIDNLLPRYSKSNLFLIKYNFINIFYLLNFILHYI